MDCLGLGSDAGGPSKNPPAPPSGWRLRSIALCSAGKRRTADWCYFAPPILGHSACRCGGISPHSTGPRTRNRVAVLAAAGRTCLHEMARFDINLAPLEFGNPYCQAKSELKFFEAALVDAPTVGFADRSVPVASSTTVKTGLSRCLAADDWYFYLTRLVNKPALRDVHRPRRLSALRWQKFGPRQRALQFRQGDRPIGSAARAPPAASRSVRSCRRELLGAALSSPRPPCRVRDATPAAAKLEVGRSSYHSTITPRLRHRGSRLGRSSRLLKTLDLVVVDDQSLLTICWAVATCPGRRAHADRFNRISRAPEQ